MTRHLTSRVGCRVPPALQRFRCQAHMLGRLFGPSLADSTANRGLQPRTISLRGKTNHPTSVLPPLPPLPPPPAQPADTALSSTFHTQAESSDGFPQNVGPGPSTERKEKADTGDRHKGDGGAQHGKCTAKSATDARHSSKRTASNAGLNEGSEGIPRSEKARRRIGQSAGPDGYIPRLIILERPYQRDR